jgi:hypothetical protein
MADIWVFSTRESFSWPEYTPQRTVCERLAIGRRFEDAQPDF